MNLPSVTAEREFAAGLVRHLPPRVARQITPVERTLLTLLVVGLTAKEISAELGKTEGTVHRQTHRLMHKFGASCRTRLVARVVFMSGVAADAGRVSAVNDHHAAY